MRSVLLRFFVAILLVLFAALVHAADQPSDDAPMSRDALAQLVKAQFGDKFRIDPMPGSSTVLVTGDFDNDGVEDAVIVTRCKEPLADQLKFGYRVIDPLDTYYGWGKPEDTVRFTSADPDRARVLLVIHSWRLPQPKAKFAVINVPFTSLSVKDTTIKKKPHTVISASDYDTDITYLFWDGKRWKYEPGASE